MKDQWQRKMARFTCFPFIVCTNVLFHDFRKSWSFEVTDLCCVLFVCLLCLLATGLWLQGQECHCSPDFPEEAQRHTCACLHVCTHMYVLAGMHLPSCVPVLECDSACVCSAGAVNPLSSDPIYPSVSLESEFQKAMELL